MSNREITKTAKLRSKTTKNTSTQGRPLTGHSVPMAVVDYLQKNNTKAYKARELAEIISNNYDEIHKYKAQRYANEEDIIKSIIADILNYKHFEDWNIIISNDRPKKFSWMQSSKQLGKNDKKRNEAKLYSQLIDYCDLMGIKAMRFDDKRSRKVGGNKWRHADILGFKSKTVEYTIETYEAMSALGYPVKQNELYAFEVKIDVNVASRLREAFLETIGNSSWANYTYIVLEKLPTEEAMTEIRLLSDMFKIGLIVLDESGTNEDSEIVIPAPRTEVHWEMIDRIVSETDNPDFRRYLKNIKLEVTGMASQAKWGDNNHKSNKKNG